MAKISKSNAESIGAELRARRLSRGFTLKDVELATRIRGKYLVAIEADDYTQLPHDVYTRGFVQSYADFLKLDSTKILDHYNKQRGKAEVSLGRKAKRSRPRITLTPRLLTALTTFVVVGLIGTYLAWQLSALTAAPNLQVANPDKDQVLYGSLITITGHVAGGADVFVNDSPILVDDNGNFTDAIALQDGVNSIHVSAKNRLGKTTLITRNVLAHVPKTDPASSLPVAPFDGVAVSVQTQGSAATVTVVVDGKQTFHGTMLPGTIQTFKGASSVAVSTSNAGATNLIITNATAANKNLGSLGTNGQAKNNFEFAKDTQFQ